MFSIRTSGFIVKACSSKELLCGERVLGRGRMVVVEDMDDGKKRRPNPAGLLHGEYIRI